MVYWLLYFSFYRRSNRNKDTCALWTYSWKGDWLIDHFWHKYWPLILAYHWSTGLGWSVREANSWSARLAGQCGHPWPPGPAAEWGDQVTSHQMLILTTDTYRDITLSAWTSRVTACPANTLRGCNTKCQMDSCFSGNSNKTSMASDWSTLTMCHLYWPLIGLHWSCDLNTGL